MIVIRLPIAQPSPSARTETGTAERISSPSVRTPRERSQLCSAPLTAARKTSLTVPPSAFLTSLRSASGTRIQLTRRCGPIGPLSGVSGAWLMRAPGDLADAGDCLARLVDRLRRAAEARPSRAGRGSNGVSARSVTPLATTLGVAGLRSRGPAALRRLDLLAVALRGRTEPCVRSAPDTPSTSAWWVLLTITNLSRSKPSTSHSSHSGLDRSRRWEKTGGPPGAAAARRCRAPAARCGARGSRC